MLLSLIESNEATTNRLAVIALSGRQALSCNNQTKLGANFIMTQ